MEETKSKRSVAGMIVLGIIGALDLAFYITILVNSFRNYSFLIFTSFARFIIFSLLILTPFIVCLISVFFLQRMQKKSKIKIYCLVGATVIISLIFAIAMSAVSPFASQTSKRENYLKFDESCPISYFPYNSLFPDSIPEKSEKVKYNYCYYNYPDLIYEVYAEWKLPREEYEKEKSKILSKYSSVQVKEKGKFNCIYISEEEKSNLDYIFFAYDDESLTVRYIVSYIESVDKNDVIPNFETLKW